MISVKPESSLASRDESNLFISLEMSLKFGSSTSSMVSSSNMLTGLGSTARESSWTGNISDTTGKSGNFPSVVSAESWVDVSVADALVTSDMVEVSGVFGAVEVNASTSWNIWLVLFQRI